MSAALLSVRRLCISLRQPGGTLPVVENLDLDIEGGEMLGLAGESGCGKSVTALALLGLLPPATWQVSADRLRLGTRDFAGADEAAWRTVRGRQVAMVFQDPSAALDPVFTIGQQVAFAARRGGRGATRARAGGVARAAARAALERVGFEQAGTIMHAYPHQLSGGMRQLAMLAMAVAAEPALLVADEPTTALDVITQARLLEQLDRIRSEDGIGVLLISHDLGVVARHARQAMIMYAGRVVERGPSDAVFTRPAHPYTAGLLAALPTLDDGPPRRVRPIPGRVPEPGERATACPFAPRCGRADGICSRREPLMEGPGRAGAACHHPL